LADETRWPEELLREHAEAFRWAMPRAFGGEELEPLELHRRYEQLARKSLALALILTQRDSAVGIIAAGGNDRLLAEVRDGAFVTVGIAQLSTSRQGGAPALAYRDGRVDGVIPWATGAAKAKYIVAGAAADSGRQILFALPSDAPGVAIEPPLPLVALRETWTSRVRCENVEIGRDLLLLGPAPNVLSLRRRSVPIPQAFLALGHARGGVDLIAEHNSDRARNLVRKFGEQIDALHVRVVAACQSDADPQIIPLLRGECNELALRVTHAAVALYKGNALLLSHPAQRLAREAMFLLVWSCPDPVIDCTVDLLAEG
jgi:alkylation response protein AidB-like acyl-CoA dehydrogenase